MKSLYQILFLIVISIIFLNCQTTQYNEPIDMPQEEIKKFKAYEMATQVPRVVTSGKYYTCEDEKKGNCMITICSDNPTKETGLECKLYIPKTDSTSSSPMKKYENNYIKDMIDKKLAVYKTDENQIKDFCNKDNVLCYMNAKLFPNNKITTSKSYSVVTYKDSYVLNKNGEQKFEVTVYEVK